MKQFYLLTIFLLLLSSSANSAIIHEEDFTDVAPWTVNGGSQNTDYYLLSDGESIISPTIDVCSYTNLSLTLNLRSYGSGTYPTALVEISEDNGNTWSQSFTVPSSGTVPNSYTDYTISLGTVASSELIIRVTKSSGSRDLRVNHAELSGTASSNQCSSDTKAEFSISNDDIVESGATYDIPFLVTNPSSSSATVITLQLIGGDASLTDDFAAIYDNISITIPANTSSYLYSLDINNNSICAPNGNLEFEITSVSGGQGSASVGLQNTFTLSVTDDEGVNGIQYVQDFDGGTPDWTYTEYDENNEATFGQVNSLSNINYSGISGNFFGINDANDEDRIEFATVSTNGMTNIEFSFDYDVYEFDSGDDMFYELFFDGISQGKTQFISGYSNFSQEGTITVSVPNGTNTVAAILYVNQNGGSDYAAWDNIQITADNCLVSAPEIKVTGNLIEILDGDITPSSSDDTDFGDVLVAGGSNINTFTIENTGSEILNISSITSSNASEFSISGITTPTVIPASSSTTFDITFDPTVTGQRLSTITINNDDSNENPYTFVVEGNGTAIPDIILSSNNPAVPITNINQGTDDNIIYAFNLSVTSSDAIFTAFDFTTSGTYAASNITNFKAWYSSDATFNSATDIQLGNQLSSSLGSGSHTFNGFNRNISSGTTAYIFITADIPCDATDGNNLMINAISTSDLTFNSGNKSGNASDGGLQTFVTVPPNDVSNLSSSNCRNEGSTISWNTATGCVDNYLVVASLSSLTTTPSGNGISYTANSIYGIGTAYDNGFVIYKGNGNNVDVTNLSNGTNYTFTVFTRKDLNWSNGVEINCTPTLNYCDSYADASTDDQTGITLVSFNTINNSSSGDPEYSDFTGISTDVTIGLSYDLEIEVDVYGYQNYTRAWIDWNHDGDFDDSNEAYDLGDTYDPDVLAYNSPLSITIPSGASTGNTRMRIATQYFYDEPADPDYSPEFLGPCETTYEYGEVEDYTINIINPCTPVHAISSFTPESGPVSTDIIINGSNFSASSTVSFNGVSATSVQFVNSSKLIVTVPAGASTGKITITESGCSTESSSNFTLLENSSTCYGTSNAFTGLIISEVYDADANNVAYIELYNPGPSSINLDTEDYEIHIRNDNNYVTRVVNLYGTINANETYVVSFGTSTHTCLGYYDYSSSGSGINGDDGVDLVKAGVIIDHVVLPGQTGYSVERLTSANGPTATYNSADWDVSLIETCSGLGTFNSTPPVNAPFIDEDANNYTACSDIDITISVIEGDSSILNDITYQWYFTDGISIGWTEVSDANLPGFLTDGTSDNLVILEDGGSLSSLDGYQFYAEVIENGSCNSFSSATTFNQDIQPYFRSKTGVIGYWDEVVNWEMSLDKITWKDACEPPNYANAFSTLISSNSTIIIRDGIGAPDVAIDSLIIDENATLEIEPDAELEIHKTSGADLTVNGTLIDRANNGNNNGVNFLNNSSWEILPDDTIKFTNNGAKIGYRDNYIGGISNIPSNAHWFYTHSPIDGNVVSTISVGMHYPNLYFESEDVNGHQFTSFTEVLIGNLSNTVIKGDLRIGVSNNSDAIVVLNNNFHSDPIIVEGNLYIGNNSTFSNQTYRSFDGLAETVNYNVQYKEGTGLELKGSAVIDGILNLNNNQTGLLKFSGITIQDVTGNDSINVWNVILDETGSGELDLAIPLVIGNDIALQNGTLDIQNSSIFIKLAGDWINSKAFYNHGNAPVIFMGSSDEEIQSNLQRFYKVEVKNTNNSIVYPINDNVEIENMLEIFTDGHFQTPGNIEVATEKCKVNTNGQLSIKTNGIMKVAE